MPKVFKYQVGDKVVVSKMKDNTLLWIGKKGAISELREISEYDYRVDFDSIGHYFFYEDELTKLNIHNFEIGQFVKFKSSNEVGQIVLIDEEHEQLELEYTDFTMGIVDFSQVEHYRHEGNDEEMILEEDENVVDHLLETLLSQYKNENGMYTVPEQLLKSMLNQLYYEE